MLAFGRKPLVALAASVALCAPLAVQAQAHQVDNSQWLIEEGDAGCTMRGRLADNTTLVVRSARGQYSVLLASRRFPASLESADRVTLDLRPVSIRLEADGAMSLGDRRGDSVWFDSLPSDFIQTLGRSSSMTLSADGRAVTSLAIPQAGAATRAFAVCEAAARGQ